MPEWLDTTRLQPPEPGATDEELRPLLVPARLVKPIRQMNQRAE